MSQVQVNPDELRAFARKLLNYTAGVQQEMVHIKKGLDVVSQTWKDAQYQKFDRDFKETMQELNRFRQEMEGFSPRMVALANALDPYHGASATPTSVPAGVYQPTAEAQTVQQAAVSGTGQVAQNAQSVQQTTVNGGVQSVHDAPNVPQVRNLVNLEIGGGGEVAKAAGEIANFAGKYIDAVDDVFTRVGRGWGLRGKRVILEDGTKGIGEGVNNRVLVLRREAKDTSGRKLIVKDHIPWEKFKAMRYKTIEEAPE